MSQVEVTAEVLRELQKLVDEHLEAGMDGVDDHSIRKGDAYYPIDGIDDWSKFVGCPVTNTPGAWLVAWSPEYDNDELIDNWESKQQLLEAQATENEEEDPDDRRVVLIVGYFVDGKGKRKPVEVLTVEQANSIKKSVKNG